MRGDDGCGERTGRKLRESKGSLLGSQGWLLAGSLATVVEDSRDEQSGQALAVTLDHNMIVEQYHLYTLYVSPRCERDFTSLVL